MASPVPLPLSQQLASYVLFCFCFLSSITIMQVPWKSDFFVYLLYPHHLAWPENNRCPINTSEWMIPWYQCPWTLPSPYCFRLLCFFLTLLTSFSIFLSLFYHHHHHHSYNHHIKWFAFLFVENLKTMAVHGKSLLAIVHREQGRPIIALQLDISQPPSGRLLPSWNPLLRVCFSPGHLWKVTSLVR